MVLSAAWVVSTAHAQLLGIPDGLAPMNTGCVLTADLGQPDSGDAWALGGGLGYGRVGFGFAFGQRDFGHSVDGSTYGGRVGLRLFGGSGVLPFTIGAQVGASTVDTGSERISLALPAVVGRIAVPLIPIKPWGVLAYRVGDNIDDEWRFTFGVDVNILPGLGVHGAYEWGDIETLWGVGAHFRFSIPGLPLVPGV